MTARSPAGTRTPTRPYTVPFFQHRLPLSRALPLLLAALLFSSVAVIATVTTSALDRSLSGQLDAELTLLAERSAGTAVATGQATVSPDDPVPPGLTRWPQARMVSVDLRDGRVRAGYIDDSDHPAYHQLDADQIAALMRLPVNGQLYTVQLPDLGTYRAVAFKDTSGARQVTAVPTAEVSETIAQYTLVQLLVIAVAGIGAVLLGWLLIRRALHPLEIVAGTAQRVASRELATGDETITERIPDAFVDDVTEVGRVAGSFNRMLTHIDEAFAVRRRSERKLRRFVADASHELRTPLASIRGYTQLVLRESGDLPPEAVEQLGRVRAESERMSDLVEDLLLLARLDNEPVIRREPVDLRGLLIDAVADAHAAGPGHHWQLDLDASRPLEVLGDENSLRQVLVNLLANARVHTPEGTNVVLAAHAEPVPVTAGRVTGADSADPSQPGASTGSSTRGGDADEGAGGRLGGIRAARERRRQARAQARNAAPTVPEARPDAGRVRIEVRDDGQGIPPDKLDSVFDRFVKADDSRARLNGGSTGLGLSIVLALVHAHGGSVSVTSHQATPEDPSHGTVFTVLLPMLPAEPDEPDVPEEPDAQAGRLGA